MKSLVINVNCDWQQVMDPLFIPNVDYINIQSDSLSNIKNTILDIINSGKHAGLTLKQIIANGHSKGKLLTRNNIYSVFQYILESYNNRVIHNAKSNNNMNVNIYYVKKYILEIGNIVPYNIINFYERIEQLNLAVCIIPLLNYYIKKNILYLIYPKAEVIDIKYSSELEAISDSYHSLLMNTGEFKVDSKYMPTTILKYNNSYRLFGFKYWITKEHINAA